MRSVIFIIFFSLFSIASSQSISCDYADTSDGYTCLMTIDNLNGFDNFQSISGTHIQGRTDNEIRAVEIILGTTTIIPKIICQQFGFLTRIRSNGRGVQFITDTSFSNCLSLTHVFLNQNPIESFHRFSFRNNANLLDFETTQGRLLELPFDLFHSTPLLSNIRIESSRDLSDLPPGFFQNCPQLNTAIIRTSRIPQWRAEWLQKNQRVAMVLFQQNQFSSIPRNALNSTQLFDLHLSTNQLRELDYFSLNHVGRIRTIDVQQNPFEALDFNIIERATTMSRFLGLGSICYNGNIENFGGNREANIALLEPCFAAFDRRVLEFNTFGFEQVFNSIRRERIIVSIRVPNSAFLTFSNNYDGSGSNFEIHLGVEGNSQSMIFENGNFELLRSTPGILNSNTFVDFEISWENGLIIVSGPFPIMAHLRTDLFPVRFIGVRTSGFNAAWNIRQVV